MNDALEFRPRPAESEPEWDTLLLRYLDGLSTDAETQRVEERLTVDAALRQQLVEFSLTRSMLPALLTTVAAEPGHATGTNAQASRPGSSRRSVLASRNWSVIVAIAALVLLAIGLNSKLFRTAPTDSETLRVVRLEASSAVTLVAENGAARPLTADAELMAGDRVTLPADARLALRYRDGTQLALEGGAVMRIEQGQPIRTGIRSKEVLLEAGALTGDVSPQPVGYPFVLRTPNAHATVLGTVFTLQVRPGVTDLDVQRGRVRLTRSSDGASVEVPAGSLASADELRALTVTSRSGDAASAAGEFSNEGRQLVTMNRTDVTAFLAAFAKSQPRSRLLPARQVLFTIAPNFAAERAFALKAGGNPQELSGYDVAQPNEEYFQHLDFILQTAADLNIGLRFVALRTADLEAAKTFLDEASGERFGQWLRSRYAGRIGTTLLLTDFDGSLPRGAAKPVILGTMQFVASATGVSQPKRTQP